MERQETQFEISIPRILHALWHRAWAILLAVILFGAAAFSYTYFLVTPKYTAQTLFYVNNSEISIGSTEIGISAGELAVAQRLVDTYIVILQTRTTLEDVISLSGVDYTYEQLSGMISSDAVNETEIFYVEVTSKDPQEAEMLANTIGKVLPGKISSIVDGSSVRIVDYAVVPSRQSSPNIVRNTLVGVLLGIVIACAIIIVREMLDDQIHSSQTIAHRYDIPILSVIPDIMTKASGHSRYYYQNEYERHPSTKEEEGAE